MDGGAVVEADTALVAFGRTPNADHVDLDAAGIDVNNTASSPWAAIQRTPTDGGWALGDV